MKTGNCLPLKHRLPITALRWNCSKKVLEHEKYVTSRIHDMYEVALAEKDYAAQSHLKWFIDEQVEEEASASEIVEKLQMVGDNVGGLFIIDGQLGARK